MGKTSIPDDLFQTLLSNTIAEYSSAGLDLQAARTLAREDLRRDFRSHSEEDQLDHDESRAGDPYR